MKNKKTFLLILNILMVVSCTPSTNSQSNFSNETSKVSSILSESESSSSDLSSSSSSSSENNEFKLVLGWVLAKESYVGNAVPYPEYRAQSSKGEDITHLVAIEDNLKSIIDKDAGEFTPLESGTHILTYSVTDPYIKETITKTKEVIAYRRIFNPSSSSSLTLNELCEDSKQTAIQNDLGMGISRLNMEASKVYYAEMTMENLVSTSSSLFIGMAHYYSSGPRWLCSYVDTTKCSFNIGDKSSWGNDNTYGHFMLPEHDVMTKNDETFKIAIARDGEYFYSFINDQYVGGILDSFYSSNDTIPALYTNLYGNQQLVTNNGGIHLSEIDYCSGEEAQDKIDSLLGGTNRVKTTRSYCPVKEYWGQSLENNFIYTDNGLTFTRTDTGHNGGQLSPYILFYGDFTIEFTYKNTGYRPSDPSGTQNRAWLEVRDANRGNESIHLGGIFNNSSSGGQFMLSNAATSSWYEPSLSVLGANVSEGCRYVLSRKVNDDGSALYNLKIYPLVSDASAQYQYLEKEYTDTSWNHSTMPATVNFHNKYASGEYSNIKWKSGYQSL